MILTLGNLRGIRESGNIFAAPTYFFIVSVLALIAVGAWRAMTGTVMPSRADRTDGSRSASRSRCFLLLRAFSNGCTAMTGVEAVSNGVPAFRPPEARNAAATMVIMAVLAITMFLGITLLAQAYGILPSEQETVISQLARGVFGGRGVPYYLVQAATMLILVLAANTAYADFPRLASILARDRYLPRQFMNQGDRLAFSNGILGLSAFAGAAARRLRRRHARADSAVHDRRLRVVHAVAGGHGRALADASRSGVANSAAISGIGALVTGVVLIVVAVTKAHEGAWIIMLLIPDSGRALPNHKAHYNDVAAQLTLTDWQPERAARQPGDRPDQRRSARGGRRARLRADAVFRRARRVHRRRSCVDRRRYRSDWDKWGRGVPLVVLPSPFRSLMEPLLEYIEQLDAEHPDDYVTVVLPEFVPARWWHHLFHNQRALLIKGALLFKPNTIVTSVPFHLAR